LQISEFTELKGKAVAITFDGAVQKPLLDAGGAAGAQRIVHHRSGGTVAQRDGVRATARLWYLLRDGILQTLNDLA